MNFEDEPYARLYTKRTHTNRALRWDGRMVMHEMMYEFDRAGIFEFVGDLDEAIETMTGIPLEHVRTGLARLLKLHVWTVVRPHDPTTGRSGVLFWPPWLHAQTCKRSDAARQRDHRARGAAEERAAQLLGQGGQPVTERDQASHGVTARDPESRGVTEPIEGVTNGHSRSHSVTLCSADPLLPSAAPDSDARAHEGDPTPDVQAAIPELQARASDYVRDRFGAGLSHQPPETWPEVIEAFGAFAAVFPAAGKLRPRDGRVEVIVARFAQGFTPAELALAAAGARLDDHIERNPQHQTIATIWRDEQQVLRFMALQRAGGPTAKARPGAAPAPTQHGVDLAARRARRLAAAGGAPE